MNSNKRPLQDVSTNALSVARMLDRNASGPGTYIVTVHVSDRRRQPWNVEVSKVERLQVSVAHSA